MKKRQLSLSGEIQKELRQIGRHCQELGREQEFVQAVTRIVEGLTSKPVPPTTADSTFGCPQYHLPNLGLLVCVAAVAPIAVLFGVTEPRLLDNGDDQGPIYIMRFRLMTSSVT